MYVKQLNAYTVAQLKEELVARELETTGKKAELLVHLAAYLEEHVDDELVEALALGELPKKGTPTKAGKQDDLDTSEIVEEEAETETNGADAENTEAEEKKEDADASMEETKENGDASAETEEAEQSIDDAMAETSELKVLDEVGPDDEEDTKKEEEEKKKKKKKKQMFSWPRLDELLQEKRLALKLRTIVIGPVEVTDLDNEVIREMATEAESFHYKTTTIKNTKVNKGLINACLKDKETCESFVEKLSGFRDNVRVEQCGFNMSQEKFFREITKEDEEDVGPKPERMEYRTAIIRNLPEDPNVDTVKELFPDAPNINIVRDQEGKCKGWAYTEFTTSKAAQEFIDTHRSKKDDERPKMDDETLRVGTLQHIGRLFMEVKKKDDGKEKEKVKERPEGLLSDEERIRKPQLIRMWKQRLQNLEPLKKTRPEYYERQKKTLEENISKAEKAVEEDDAKRKEHGIPIPDAKKEAEKKKEEKKKDRKNEVRPMRPMKRKSDGPGRSEYQYRPQVRDVKQDYGRARPNRMTREEWQQNRSNWTAGAAQGGTNATANAVNLIVGLSKIFGGNSAGGSQYDSLTTGYSGGGGGSFSGGSGTWNGSGSSSSWGSAQVSAKSIRPKQDSNKGSGSRGTYSGGFSSSTGPSSKRRRPMTSSTPGRGAVGSGFSGRGAGGSGGGFTRSMGGSGFGGRSTGGGAFGGKRQAQLDQMRSGRR